MKRIFYIFMIAILITGCTGVPNTNCTVSSTAENYYKYEAAQLAIDQLVAEGNPGASQIIIPNDYYLAYLKALGLVYDATSWEADSVVNMHLFCENNITHGIIIQTSGVPSWVDNWMNGIVPTGNSTVDNAISSYSLSITELPNMSPNPWYVIESTGPLNGQALASLFISIPGVNAAEPNAYWSFYSKLTGTFSGDIAHLIFYEGWGDCPAGCFGYHQWKFDVNVATCTVTFTGYTP